MKTFENILFLLCLIGGAWGILYCSDVLRCEQITILSVLLIGGLVCWIKELWKGRKK